MFLFKSTLSFETSLLTVKRNMFIPSMCWTGFQNKTPKTQESCFKRICLYIHILWNEMARVNPKSILMDSGLFNSTSWQFPGIWSLSLAFSVILGERREEEYGGKSLHFLSVYFCPQKVSPLWQQQRPAWHSTRPCAKLHSYKDL